MTKHTVDEWNDSSCLMLTCHFWARNGAIQGKKHTTTTKQNSLQYIVISSHHLAKQSPQRATVLKCHRGVQIKGQGPVSSHTFLFSLHSSLLNFILWHHHVCTLVWLRAPQGLAQGRECVYYNTLMSHTMFRFWSWLSPVGLLRLQPLLSLNLWGLINHTR